MASGDLWEKTFDLGRGTFGVVWQEQCISSQPHEPSRLRAIKQTPRKYESLWKKELDALVKFSDYREHFVQYFDCFADDRHLYIAMEYLPYGNLQSHISKRPLPETEAALVTAQLAQGLQHMHRVNFIHRDLKPSNVLVNRLGPQWHVKISDFGTAKDTAAFHSTRGEIGTEGYMAPEIYLPGDGRWTPAVDIWSLGSVAHCLLTMRPPFNAVRELISFAQQGTPFPVKAVGRASYSGVDFIQRTMTASAHNRLRIEEVLEHPWLEGTFPKSTKYQSHQTRGTFGFNMEPSNAWGNTFASEGTYRPMPAIPTNVQTDTPLSSIPASRHTATAKAAATDAFEDPSAIERASNNASFNWSNFFAECGVSPQSCKTYADTFEAEEMSTEVLSDVDAQLLRTLGLKQGDILRVMRFLGRQQGSVPSTSSSQNSHSGPSSLPFERSNRLSASAPAPNAHSSGSNTPELTKFHAYNPATPSTSMPNFQPTSAHRSRKPSDTPVYRPGNLPNTKASLRDIGSKASSNQQRSLYSYGTGSATASTPIPDILTPGGETRKGTSKYAHEPSHPTASSGAIQSTGHATYHYDAGTTPKTMPAVDQFGSGRSSSPHTGDYRRTSQATKQSQGVSSFGKPLYDYTSGNTRYSTSSTAANDSLPLPAAHSRPIYTTPSTSYTSSASAYTPSAASTAPTEYTTEEVDEYDTDYSPGYDAYDAPSDTAEQKSTQCLTCGEDFLSRNKLFDHLYYTGHHQGETDRIDPTLTCLACKQYFESRDDLFDHLENYPRHARDTRTGRPEKFHRDSAYTSATYEYSDLYAKSELTCLACDVDFADRDSLFYHLDENPSHARDRTNGRKEEYVRGYYY